MISLSNVGDSTGAGLLFPITVAMGFVVIIGWIFFAKEGTDGERTALFRVICEEIEFGLMIALFKDCDVDGISLYGEVADGDILIGVVVFVC